VILGVLSVNTSHRDDCAPSFWLSGNSQSRESYASDPPPFSGVESNFLIPEIFVYLRLGFFSLWS